MDNGVQYWRQEGSGLVAEEKAPWRMIWRTDVSTQLNVQDCDLTDATGLTESDVELLTKQLWAKGRPAPAKSLESPRGMQTFFGHPASLMHSAVSSSTSTSTSSSTTSTRTSTTQGQASVSALSSSTQAEASPFCLAHL